MKLFTIALVCLAGLPMLQADDAVPVYVAGNNVTASKLRAKLSKKTVACVVLASKEADATHKVTVREKVFDRDSRLCQGCMAYYTSALLEAKDGTLLGSIDHLYKDGQGEGAEQFTEFSGAAVSADTIADLVRFKLCKK